MSVKELFIPEDSRIEDVSGIDFSIKVKLQDIAKSSLWITVAVLLTSLLSKLV